MKNYKLQVVTDTHKSCSKCRTPRKSHLTKIPLIKQEDIFLIIVRNALSVVSLEPILRIKAQNHTKDMFEKKAYKKRFNLSFEDYQSKLMSQAICICGTNL